MELYVYSQIKLRFEGSIERIQVCLTVATRLLVLKGLGPENQNYGFGLSTSKLWIWIVYVKTVNWREQVVNGLKYHNNFITTSN
jgi:hypothetical protein